MYLPMFSWHVFKANLLDLDLVSALNSPISFGTILQVFLQGFSIFTVLEISVHSQCHHPEAERSKGQLEKPESKMRR